MWDNARSWNKISPAQKNTSKNEDSHNDAITVSLTIVITGAWPSQ